MAQNFGDDVQGIGFLNERRKQVSSEQPFPARERKMYLLRSQFQAVYIQQRRYTGHEVQSSATDAYILF